MEDHLKICLLEEVVCEFDCKQRPRQQKDLEEHGCENIETHLAFTSATSVSNKKMDSKIDKNTYHKLEEILEKKAIDKDQKMESMEKKLSAIQEIRSNREAIGNSSGKLQKDIIIHEIDFQGISPIHYPIMFEHGYNFMANISFEDSI